MLPAQFPETNLLGRDVTAAMPSAYLGGPEPMAAGHQRIWELAQPYLDVRSNDVHTLYSYAIARALTQVIDEADPEVVLPAILLHDTGWSQVAPDEVLEAIAPDGGRADLVLAHERFGAQIAAEVLAAVGHDQARTEAIVAIIDGHDSRAEALSIDDAIVKDADKLWRLTPHGVGTVMQWFGLTREQAHLLIDSRVHDRLFTEEARTMGRMLAAVAWTDTLPQRVVLG